MLHTLNFMKHYQLKNTILYESFHGASISCNPYALFLDIIDDQRFDNFRHIWVINNEKIPEQLKNKKKCIFCFKAK